MTKWDPRICGLTVGGIWCVCVFLLGMIAMAWRWGARVIDLFSVVYIGYRANLTGSLIGASWAFLDGAITGVLIAWIHNRFMT